MFEFDTKMFRVDEINAWTVVAVVAFVLVLAKGPLVPLILKIRGSAKRVKRDGVVYLHQFPRGGFLPSYSPACLKLETFLRLANVEYESVPGMKMSTKGKMPWITLDGEQICDSDCCIDFINKTVGDDLDSRMNASDAAIAHLVKRTFEEHTYWGVLYNRWVKQLPLVVSEVINLNGFAGFVVGKIASRSVYADMHHQGLSRHSEEEIYHRVERDLRAVDGALGDRNFFGGDEPVVADAVTFATVANLIWSPFESPMKTLITTELPRLVAHAERIKTRAWPDWNEQLRGGSKKDKTN